VSSPLRIVVTGLVGLYPLGGVAWDYLQYLVGLARLGHDVCYHEDTWSWPFQPVENRHVETATYSAAFLGGFFERHAPDLAGRWHYRHLHEQSYGMTWEAFRRFARTADVFLNVSGGCMIPDDLSPACVKVFLDTDPGYNQMVLAERFAWSENVERWCAAVDAHDLFFTYAENIDDPACRIPGVERAWKTTRMPIVLDLWEPVAEAEAPDDAPWTTVMTWNDFKGELVHDGVRYGSKNDELEKIIELPARAGVPLAIALGGVGAPRERLARHGWRVLDGPAITRTPHGYQEFIGGSAGELSVAKNVYVATRSGWFSCRSACYLAAGRPVVVQDTGFTRSLPVGEGIVAFETLDDAARALTEVTGNRRRHARRAREVAAACFDSTLVLERLLETISVAHA